MTPRSTTVENTNSERKLLNWVTAFVATLNIAILLPPLLIEYGFVKLGNALYSVLGYFCHQRADRSFYLFGNSVLPEKNQVWSHVPFDNIFTSHIQHRFTCNNEFGCKLGVCARCTGMYLGLLLGLVSSEFLLRLKIPKIIPILFILPLVLDGTVQTIAYILAPERGFYESTNLRRFATGLLFGFGIGYFAVSAIKPAIAKS